MGDTDDMVASRVPEEQRLLDDLPRLCGPAHLGAGAGPSSGSSEGTRRAVSNRGHTGLVLAEGSSAKARSAKSRWLKPLSCLHFRWWAVRDSNPDARVKSQKQVLLSELFGVALSWSERLGALLYKGFQSSRSCSKVG